MAIVSVSVPDELKAQMDAEKETNWSAVARKAFEERLELVKRIETFAKTADITEEDAIRMGRELKKLQRKQFE